MLAMFVYTACYNVCLHCMQHDILTLNANTRVRSDIFRSAKNKNKSEILARKFSFYAEKFLTFPISILCLID